MPVFRVDFHHHCDTDPVDVIAHSARDLADAAPRRLRRRARTRP